MFDDAAAKLGGLDCLVYNAGVPGPTGPVHEIDPKDWDRCLEVCRHDGLSRLAARADDLGSSHQHRWRHAGFGLS